MALSPFSAIDGESASAYSAWSRCARTSAKLGVYSKLVLGG
jgi:hypothetical protein